MISRNIFARLFLALLLSVLTITAPIAAISTPAQQPVRALAETELATKLAAVEKAIDDKRKELGIPGVSLVIVKDDRVIYMKGLGVKDFEKNIPVTPDTLFAIGSATKAFTSLAAMMSVDQGKLSLDDSPKKYLPYFKMRDPETDAKITVRDLLSHRSGLNRTDLAMATGKLTRAELIQVTGQAKPTAKLGEKFQYQNIMYTAAGEIVARSQKTTWDNAITTSIFKPLGMKGTDTTIAAMQRARDFSFGYDYNATTKETRRLPMRDLSKAAPTGAINSNARDMGQWLRFMLGDGTFNGKRLVSEKSFAELTTKQIAAGPNVNYGLGWFLRQWDGHKVVEHGGNIDGFNAQVAMMPDQKLGFVLLTNVTASSLGNSAMTAVWNHLVGRKAEDQPAVIAGETKDPKEEVGTYRIVRANLDLQVTIADGQLKFSVPGQPTYPLVNVGGRRYRMTDPAPDGFFVTFRPTKGKETESELYLEQPQGNAVAPKVNVDAMAMASAKEAANYSGPLAEMLGKYESDQPKVQIEIGLKEGKVALVVPGQPAYPLVEKAKDKLASPPLPETYWLDVTRDDAGKVSGLVMNQPQGNLVLRRLGTAAAPALIGVDELLAKMIAAFGGEAVLRKHKTSVTTIELDLEHQGVSGHGTIKAKAPGMFASSTKLTALGKEIGSIMSYFDGTTGGQLVSFAPEEIFTGRRLAEVKREASFYGPLAWKDAYKTITIKSLSKVGAEEVYVVEKEPAQGSKVTDYVSTKSFLVLRRDSIISSETSNIELPQVEYFSDYRTVEGAVIPFLIRSNNIANGDIITRIKEVKFDVEIPDSDFRKPVMSVEPATLKTKPRRRAARA